MAIQIPGNFDPLALHLAADGAGYNFGGENMFGVTFLSCVAVTASGQISSPTFLNGVMIMTGSATEGNISTIVRDLVLNPTGDVDLNDNNLVNVGGFYIRKLTQSAQPAYGSPPGASEVGPDELVMWEDSDDQKLYLVSADTDDANTVKKIEMV